MSDIVLASTEYHHLPCRLYNICWIWNDTCFFIEELWDRMDILTTCYHRLTYVRELVAAPCLCSVFLPSSSIFSSLQKAIKDSDAKEEPHHLWEYPGRPLTADFNIMELNFMETVPSVPIEVVGEVPFIG